MKRIHYAYGGEAAFPYTLIYPAAPEEKDDVRKAYGNIKYYFNTVEGKFIIYWEHEEEVSLG